MSVARNVYCYPVSRESTYVPLLFDGIEDRYRPVYREAGALGELARDASVIVHVHWEEFVVRECESESEADDAVERFSREIAKIGARGGAIVWTVHNELPHLVPYREHFLRLRATLAQNADAILVHNRASIDALARQVELDRSKLHLLPHPSYLGRHEDEATLEAALADPYERRIQGFGWIRLQKGFGEMIDMLPAAYLRSRDAYVRISGEGVEAAAVIARAPDRTDVAWDLRHVPDAEVPALLRSAACVVLPYERVLTSGVALLAISVGAVLVGVDIPQLRELLPPENHRFLYARGDGPALRRIVDDVLATPRPERTRVVEANLDVARALRPSSISRRLAEIYDRVLARVLQP